MGITNKACMIIVTTEATSQSRLMKSSFQSIFPTIKVSGPYSNSGMTNSPIDEMNTSITFFLLLVLQ
jgi:hypothetical protein